MPSTRILPSPRINILPPTKQAPEQRDPLASVLLLRFLWDGLASLSRKHIVGRGLGNSDAVSGQKTPQSYILVAQPLILVVALLERP
jgi:hypothetical protein